LPLSRYRVGNALKILRKDQFDRPPGFRIAAMGTRIVLGDAPFQVSAR